MTKLTSFVLGAAMALASIGLAHADGMIGGAWRLTVGMNDAPCTLTLSPDASGSAGTITPAPECPGGVSSATRWRAVGASLELYAPNGELLAALRPNGASYVGTRFSDGRRLALSR